MEWIGTGFVLTIGGMRLRVRIALEDTPEPARVPRPRTRDAEWDIDELRDAERKTSRW